MQLYIIGVLLALSLTLTGLAKNYNKTTSFSRVTIFEAIILNALLSWVYVFYTIYLAVQNKGKK